MKKNIILIVIVLLSNILLNAQEECFTPPDDNSEQRKTNYVYNPDGPVKTIRVNLHFLLKDDGTGNFTETSDNYTNRPYNGYLYAEYIVNKCNERWNKNPLLQHMPIPPVPALPKKIQLQLCGVYFHRNTTYYNNCYAGNGNEPPTLYCDNIGEVINIFITKEANGGQAYQGFSKINHSKAYANYKESVDNNDTWFISPNLYNHELGHLFGLGHIVVNCCDPYPEKPGCSKGCADNPTYQELISRGYERDSICDWNGKVWGSKNVMDYNANNHALSPMQISKMHSVIDGTKLFYRNCKYKIQSLSITSFTTNKAYIAKQVTIPSTSNIVVGNNSALFVNAEEFTINGQFEVQSGSILNIEIVPSCD
jgi:hypothetical protein